MIQVAIVGAGHWGPNLIRLLDNHRRSEVRWVIDSDEGRRAQVRERFGHVQIAADAAHAFGDPAVDAVVIATPTSTHYALTRAALEQGKHVLVEKPITTNVAEGEELCAIAERESRTLMVGHVFLYNAAVQRVKAYLEESVLGQIYYLSMVRTNLGPIRMDVNAAWDLAAHDISIANYWLESEPRSVSATAGNWINPGVEDAVFATLRYPADVVVNLHASWLHPRKARDITVVGERKMLVVDDLSLTDPVRIYDKGVTDERLTPGFIDTFASFRASVREGDITIPKVALGEPLGAEIEHFLECVETGAEPLTSGAGGVAVVRALEAVTRSIAEDGAQVEVATSLPAAGGSEERA